MRAHVVWIALAALVVASVVWLGGVGTVSAQSGSAETLPVGRYRVFRGQHDESGHLETALLLDTATGQTWRCAIDSSSQWREMSGGPSGK